MRLGRVYRIVFLKELRELLRDRRSLFWLFAPPIILPGIAIIAGLFIGAQVIRIAEDGFPLVIENGHILPQLVERFEESETLDLIEIQPDAPDPFGEAMFVVSIPLDFHEQLEANGSAPIEITTRDSSVISFLGSSTVRAVIQDYSSELLDERLNNLGINRTWLQPITIGEQRITTTSAVGRSNDEEGGNSIIATIFLPLAVTSWLLGGGMGLVLDSTVGEKERQTIENLLVTPASRIGIVLGKMSVIFLASMAVMSLWLTEGILLNALSISAPQLSAQEELGTMEAIKTVLDSSGGIIPLVLALLVMIVPFTILLNALVMGWCAYAANYREANLFMALIQLGLPATVLLTIFSLPPDVPMWFYGLPFFGTIIGIRDLFSQALSAEGLIINFITGAIYASVGIAFTAWVFGREWSLTRGLQ